MIPRRMNGAHGLRLGGHFITRQQFRRQRVLKLVHIGQRRPGAGRLPGRGQALGAVVDRHKGAFGHLGLGTYQRMQQFPMGHIAADAPLEVIGLPGDEFFRRVGGVEPGQRQHAGIIRRQHAGKHPPALDAPGRFLLQHRGPDAAVHIVGCARNGIRLGIVDVFAGVAQQQVPDGLNTQFLKLFGKGRPHALEILDGTVQIRHGAPLPSVWNIEKGELGTSPNSPFCRVFLPAYSTESI